MPVASPDVGRRPAAAGSLQVGDESVPGVVGGQGLLGRIDVGLDGVGQDRIQQRHAAGEVAVRGAGAAPARRAICSSGAFRPWSQNTCRAAPGWRGGCAGRRGERPGGWWAVCARHTAGGTGNSEGCLRIVLADRAQLVLLGPGEELTVTDAAPATRFLLMTGQPYREAPVFNGPYVD